MRYRITASGRPRFTRPESGTERYPRDSDTNRALLSRKGDLRDSKQVSTNGAADAHDRPNPLPIHCPVDGGAGDAEQVGELSRAVLAAIEQGHQVSFLPTVQLGLLTPRMPLGLGDLHALLGAQPNQVRLELSNHREHVEQQPADRVRRVVHRSAQVETNLTRGELAGDSSGVWQRPGKPVELGDDQHVAFAVSGQSFTQTGPLPVGARQPVVNVDPVDGHTQRGEAVTLGGQILLIGGASGVPMSSAAMAHLYSLAGPKQRPGYRRRP